MLRIEGLATGYGPPDILSEVTLEVRPGEVVSVIGSNGAGKTTMMRAISGLLPVRSGDILLDGRSVAAAAAHNRVQAGIVLVPEGRLVFEPLSVVDNLRLGGYSQHRRLSHAEWHEGLDRVFALFPRLKERQRQRAGSLSGGEQQMLAIGRALMARPRILLLDEPSLGLAPKIVEEIMETLVELSRGGLPLLLVEQNALLALEACQRAYLLENGRIALSGTADELKDHPRVQAAYLGGA